MAKKDKMTKIHKTPHTKTTDITRFLTEI